MAEDGDENTPRGRLFISTLMVMALLLGIIFWIVMPAAAAPSYPTPISGTRATYELNVEVDYFEGLLTPEVIDAFDFLETYFEARNITATVDFNSTNNVIVGSPYISDYEWRAIHRQYHDQPATHIHFIVARQAGGNSGQASPLYGAIINVEITELYNETRHVIMHEIGHCIGIGLQDDSIFNETYAYSGFMAMRSNSVQEYRAEDWASAFAPDGAFGNQTRKTARIWNRYSVYRELYDDTADVRGNVTGETRGGIYLKEVNGTNQYAANIDHYSGTFYFQPKPGNYTLEVSDGYRLLEPVFVNVTEREIINLGNVVIELVPAVPPEPVESPHDNRAVYMLVAISIAVILVLAFAIWVRRNDKEGRLLNPKIMAAEAIAVVILLLLTSFFWSQNDIYDARTVNGFYDDMLDRNSDGAINGSDMPLAWHSYGVGDKVVVRDRIDYIWFQPDENQTYIILPEYSGKYGEASPINVLVQGNVTETYSEGDLIMVENRMVEYEGSIYPEFNAWTIVE